MEIAIPVTPPSTGPRFTGPILKAGANAESGAAPESDGFAFGNFDKLQLVLKHIKLQPNGFQSFGAVRGRDAGSIIRL